MDAKETNSNEVLTPKRIVEELDKYIIGQEEAKKAVAIAIRNRTRRQKLPKEIRDEVYPKNILMIGPTGVGKTEIARRLAKLISAPFLKVEATKYTEVGYVGRDVESMIRDITKLSVRRVREEMAEAVKKQAETFAAERILDILLPQPQKTPQAKGTISAMLGVASKVMGELREESEEKPEKDDTEEKAKMSETREKLKTQLEEGKLDERVIEIDVHESVVPVVEVFSSSGIEEMDFNLQDMFSNVMPKRSKKRKTTVAEAKKIFTNEEIGKMLDIEAISSEAIRRVEDFGIIFIDEMDKIAGKESHSGPDVSREGVQRDILPIVEGSTVMTRHGPVRTDHILFIGSGAFYSSKPSDMIPELQGRFPIRVELKSLTADDFVRILNEPQSSLIKQYKALLETEEVHLEFERNGVKKIAEMAFSVNERTENIGARRLHTIMEKLLEEVSFTADELKGKTIFIDQNYVMEKLEDIIADTDLSKYIL